MDRTTPTIKGERAPPAQEADVPPARPK
jgi:hypothetical protein